MKLHVSSILFLAVVSVASSHKGTATINLIVNCFRDCEKILTGSALRDCRTKCQASKDWRYGNSVAQSDSTDNTDADEEMTDYRTTIIKNRQVNHKKEHVFKDGTFATAGASKSSKDASKASKDSSKAGKEKGHDEDSSKAGKETPSPESASNADHVPRSAPNPNPTPDSPKPTPEPTREPTPSPVTAPGVNPVPRSAPVPAPVPRSAPVPSSGDYAGVGVAYTAISALIGFYLWRK